MSQEKNFINILDIPFTTLKEPELLEKIKNSLDSQNQQLFIATPNPEILLQSQINPKFRKILQHTNLNIPDGNGIIWANKFQQKAKKYHSKIMIRLIGISSLLSFLFQHKNNQKDFNKAIHGSDLMYQICTGKQFQKHQIFLLGNADGLKPDTAKLTAQKLQQINPNIKISGYLDISSKLGPNQTIIDKINQSKAEIIFVALGAPTQEIWLSENLPKLQHIKIAMGVGGSFDFIAGIIPRAPIWLRNIGLEWTYRLAKQPIKRAKRIFNALIVFPAKIIENRLKHDNKN